MKKRCLTAALLVGAFLVSILNLQPQGGTAAALPPREDRTAPANRSVGAVVPSDRLSSTRNKIEPALLKQLLEGSPDDHHRFIVELDSRVDLASLPDKLSRIDRRRQVVTLLQDTARRSQAELITFLQARHAEGRAQQIRPFWIFNGLAGAADADTLLDLATRPEVRIIRLDHWRRWVDSPTASTVPTLLQESERQDLDDGGVEWNIAQVQADRAWEAFGLDGSGVTVAIMDTGVDWQHPALQTQYRGYKPDGLTIHLGNWYCATDEGYLYPVDGNGHGTHVAGTAVGSQDSAGQAIGMAPGAHWIAVKMLRDSGYGYESWIHAAFEWIMAPADDPALAPDIVNGSWGTPDDDNEGLRPDLQALRAAGIVPVFSAGNYGPNDSTLESPASHPEAIAVGASDDLDNVATFSSRGPSPWDEIKPEVVAPGVQIRSTFPGGTYVEFNGTSMAAPHVSGLVALLLQADPTLTVDQVEELITSTAVPLGEETPNNEGGWGRIDAHEAAAVVLEAGFITGQVTRYPGSQPLPMAEITVFDHLGELRTRVQTDETGHYQVALPPDQYNLEVEAFGYAPQSLPNVWVQTGLTTVVDANLHPLPTGTLWGQISNAETGGPVGAELFIVDTPAYATSDPQTGSYSLALPEGIYTLQVAQNGFRRRTVGGIEIVADETTELDVALDPAPTLLLVDSGRWYYGSQITYLEQALDDRDYVYATWEIRDPFTDVPQLDDLNAYEIALWSAPQDAPGIIGAGDIITDYLSLGGNLFLTGQDIGFWDSGLSAVGWHPYYIEFLRTKAVADDAGRGSVVGQPDEIFSGLSLPLNGEDSAANQSSPDEIVPLDPRDVALIGHYEGDGGAAIRARACQSWKAVYLAAGLEGLGDRASRAEVMDRALTWLDAPHPAVGVELYPPVQDQVKLADLALTYTLELRNTGVASDHFALELSPSAWEASVWDETFSQPLSQGVTVGACQTQTLGLRIEVPPDVSWNITDVVTLTARSEADPSTSAHATFTSKTPAAVLLVDGHRWYDVVDRYKAALKANRVPYDVWSIDPDSVPGADRPSLQRLQNYPVVAWFTAYDWYSTLSTDDETRLSAYLDGGGRLLLSSQDYLYTSGVSSFATDYLGVANYTESLTATQVMGTVESPIGDGLGLQELTYPFRNWSDALRFTPNAQPAFWGQHGQPIALTVDEVAWKTAFFAFPLEAFESQEMATMVGKTVSWLSPLGDSSMTVDRLVALGGEQLAYTLTIRNSGPDLLSSVALSNTVPLSTSYVAGSLEGPATYDAVSNRILWDGALEAGGSATIRYNLQLDPQLPDGTVVRNVAHLSDDRGLNVNRGATSRVNTPNLSGSVKAASTEIAAPGQMVTYSLLLRNDGSSPAQAQLEDPFPQYADPLPELAWASKGLLVPTTEALLWTGIIPEGQAVTITFPVIISPSAIGLYVLNRASLDDGWGEVRTIETYTWTQARIYLPLVYR